MAVLHVVAVTAQVRFLVMAFMSWTRRETVQRFHGVTVSIQDFESCDPSSNLGGTLAAAIAQLGERQTEVLKCSSHGRGIALIAQR